MAERTCSIDGCERPHIAKGYCRPHYMSLGRPKCSLDGCNVTVRARGLCSTHYSRLMAGRDLAPPVRAMRRSGSLCEVVGCGRIHHSKGYCRSHLKQLRRGEPFAEVRTPRPKGSALERDERGRKQCGRCCNWRIESDFPACRDQGDGLDLVCRRCNRDKHLRRTFGLSLEEVEALLASQGDACAVCRAAEPDAINWHIDHDHSCCPGKASCGRCIRGALCRGCNVALGAARDDPATLRALADYLEKAVNDG